MYAPEQNGSIEHRTKCFTPPNNIELPSCHVYDQTKQHTIYSQKAHHHAGNMKLLLAMTAVRSVLLLVAFSYPALAWTNIAGLPLSLRRFSSQHSCCVSPSIHVCGGSSSLCSTPIHPASRPKTGLNGRQVPTCKLERLPRRTLKRAVPIRPNAERWVAYFGQTATERRRRVVDALAVAFVVYWTAFFASRTLLGALAWRAFYLAVFIQGFLRPLVESRSRALELWGAGNNEARSKTRGALFTGRLDVCCEQSIYKLQFESVSPR